jgi:hypothetical protein
MKSFWITIRMGRADILDSEIEDGTVEAWLQERLEHAARSSVATERSALKESTRCERRWI